MTVAGFNVFPGFTRCAGEERVPPRKEQNWRSLKTLW